MSEKKTDATAILLKQIRSFVDKHPFFSILFSLGLMGIAVGSFEEDSFISAMVNEKSATAVKWDDDIVAPKTKELSALSMCRTMYKDSARSAGYDWDVCMFCTEATGSDMFWSVEIDGKMKTASGAWVKNKARCLVHKKDREITSFVLEHGGQMVDPISGAFRARRK